MAGNLPNTIGTGVHNREACLKVLFTLCLTNESFFVLLYLIHHAELGGNIAATVRLLATHPECSSKPLTIMGADEG